MVLRAVRSWGEGMSRDDDVDDESDDERISREGKEKAEKLKWKGERKEKKRNAMLIVFDSQR